MLLPDWFLPAFVIFLFLAVVGGYVGAIAAQWSFRSMLYSLQSEVEVLEASLTSEIKRRAALSKPSREKDDELLDKLTGAGARQPARPEMWWEKFVQPKGQDQ